MNRNMVYFTQRVLSAATSAAVYVIADVLSDRTRNRGRQQPAFYNNRNDKGKTYKEPPKTQYTKPPQSVAGNTPYRSMSEQAKDKRRRGQ